MVLAKFFLYLFFYVFIQGQKKKIHERKHDIPPPQASVFNVRSQFAGASHLKMTSRLFPKKILLYMFSFRIWCNHHLTQTCRVVCYMQNFIKALNQSIRCTFVNQLVSHCMPQQHPPPQFVPRSQILYLHMSPSKDHSLHRTN